MSTSTVNHTVGKDSNTTGNVSINTFLSPTFTRHDTLQLAHTQQQDQENITPTIHENDKKLAQEVYDREIAEQYDPWKQAEREWAAIESRQNVDRDLKLAKSLEADELHASRRKKQQQLEKDAEFAKRLDANPTPQKKK